MARDLQFVYGTTTIGGSSANTPVDVYRVRHGWPRSTFSCEFLVSDTTYAGFAAQCLAIEQALRLPRQALVVTLGGSTVMSLDPTTSANSGFNADASIERVSDAIENWGLVRRYRFSVSFERPADFDSLLGRRDETVSIHTDLLKRRVVSFSGVWTAMPGKDGLAQYAAQAGTHFAAELTTIDPTATWTKAFEDLDDDDTDKLVRYTVVFWECVNGRRESTVNVSLSPANVAAVTVSGVYVATLAPATTARANYTASEGAHSTAILAALGITFYELVSESTSDNEQDQTLNFTRTYRELIHLQSPGVHDDPDIVQDTIEIATVRYPINDSPVPSGGRRGVINPAPAVGLTPTTQDRGGTNPPGTQDGGTGGGQVKKMVDLQVRYTAWLARTVTDLKAKWDSSLRAYMYTLVAQKLKISATLVDTENVQLDVPNNRIMCNLLLKGLEGTLFELDINVSKSEDLGMLATPLLNGVANSYLLQQGPTRVVYTRSVRAVYQSGSFDISTLMNSPPSSNLVLLSRSTPVSRTKQYGALGLGLGLLTLVEVQFGETWLLVGAATGNAASAVVGGSPGGAPGGAGGAGGGTGVNAVPGQPGGGRGGGGIFGIGGLGDGGSGGFDFGVAAQDVTFGGKSGV